jgi:DNA-binding CsgD family transcriptional regulator/PAS domain-containing protein
MARSEHSLEAFSKTVEAIYDCALNPHGWLHALRLIGGLTDSPCMGLGITDYAQQRVVHGVNYGYDPAYLKVYFEKFAVNPLFSVGHLRPVGDVYTLRMLIQENEFLESRFYREWSKPQGLGDLVGLNAVRSGQRAGGISGNRMLSQPRYGEDDLRIFRLLGPHVCRTFAISDALDLRSVTSEALEATLDALASGVYLTDREARIVYMNRAAERQIKACNSLGIVNNRLTPVSHAARPLMTRAIAEAIGDEAAAPSGGISMALPDGDGAGLVATILPLNRGRRRDLSGPFAAAAAIFVQDPIVAPLYPGEAFAKLYGLTGAELRVLLSMAPGLGVKEAAAMLGIGEVTARTHLQHIFSKTGASKQTELLNLLKNSTPPVNIE